MWPCLKLAGMCLKFARIHTYDCVYFHHLEWLAQKRKQGMAQLSRIIAHLHFLSLHVDPLNARNTFYFFGRSSSNKENKILTCISLVVEGLALMKVFLSSWAGPSRETIPGSIYMHWIQVTFKYVCYGSPIALTSQESMDLFTGECA